MASDLRALAKKLSDDPESFNEWDQDALEEAAAELERWNEIACSSCRNDYDAASDAGGDDAKRS